MNTGCFFINGDQPRQSQVPVDRQSQGHHRCSRGVSQPRSNLTLPRQRLSCVRVCGSSGGSQISQRAFIHPSIHPPIETSDGSSANSAPQRGRANLSCVAMTTATGTPPETSAALSPSALAALTRVGEDGPLCNADRAGVAVVPSTPALWLGW